MRLLTALVTALFLTLPVSAVFEDQAYQTDWHLSLVGTPRIPTSFFHRPQSDSKASLIYSLTEEGVLSALNPKDGEIIWRQPLPDGSPSHLKHISNTIVSARGNSLAAWNALDGKLLWSSKQRHSVLDLAIHGRFLVVLLDNGSVKKLDRSSGESLWEWKSQSKCVVPPPLSPPKLIPLQYGGPNPIVCHLGRARSAVAGQERSLDWHNI